jgi:hypothetical protein|eukprot:COSAG01_NODE_570_length_15328_cov_82.520783_22_plen_112_part_00
MQDPRPAIDGGTTALAQGGSSRAAQRCRQAASQPASQPGKRAGHTSPASMTSLGGAPSADCSAPNGCLIEAPWMVNGGHGASLRQPFGSPTSASAPQRRRCASASAGCQSR